MNILTPSIVKSERASDYQKMRIEVVSLVHAASNRLSGLGEMRAGMYLQLPADNLPDHRKVFTREYIVSPGEMVRQNLRPEDILPRMNEIVLATPIRHDARRNEDTVLDPQSPYFLQAWQRILPVIEPAIQNFRREVADIMSIYEGFTQPSVSLPKCSAFHAQAAFENKELIEAYRVAYSLPAWPEPTLTAEGRTMLEKFGVPTHHIAERSATAMRPEESIAQYALPKAPIALREAAQGMAHGKEVQMILHTLGQAIVRGEIAGLVMDERFRSALQKAVEEARGAQMMVQPARETYHAELGN